VLCSANPEDTDNAAAAISGRYPIADDRVTPCRAGQKSLAEATLCAVEPVQVPRKPEQEVRGVARARFRDAPEAALDLGGTEERKRAVERMLRSVDLAAGQGPSEPVARGPCCRRLDP
jgi:hypothetical protein